MARALEESAFGKAAKFMIPQRAYTDKLNLSILLILELYQLLKSSSVGKVTLMRAVVIMSFIILTEGRVYEPNSSVRSDEYSVTEQDARQRDVQCSKSRLHILN